MAVTKTQFRGKQDLGLGPELVSDWDMEAAGVGSWGVYGGATLSKESGRAMAGDQVLRTTKNSGDSQGAYQVVFQAATTFRVSGWARGDGTSYPLIMQSGNAVWTGTTSTSWQWFDVIHTTIGSNYLYLRAQGGVATNWCEFDNISVKEVFHPQIEWKTDNGPATTSNITSGFIGSTPWVLSNGTWKIEADTIGGRTVKAMTSVAVNGVAYLPISAMNLTPSEAGYGTWDFYINRAGAATTLVVYLVSSDGAGTTGYSVQLNSEYFNVFEDASSKLHSVSGLITAGQWHNVRVTRSDAGEFTCYLDGTLVTPNAVLGGTNPFTDTTYTTSNYIVILANAGDKLSLGDTAGDRCFAKYKGVV